MSTTATYTVRGMTCGHCVASVTEELEGVDSVQDVAVELESGTVTVTVTSESPLDAATVKAAVEEAGFELVS